MNLRTAHALFGLIRSCYEASKRYPPGDPVYVQTFRHAVVGLSEWADAQGDIRLDLSEGYFKLNGEYLPPPVMESEHTLWLTLQFKERNINDMTLVNGMDMEELEAITALLVTPPGHFPIADSAKQFFNGKRINRIRVNTVTPEIQGMTPMPGQREEELPVVEQDPNLLVGGGHIQREEEEDDGKSSLFISKEERRKLRKSMAANILAGRLDIIAQTLKMMVQDMASTDRETREIGYSGFNVITEVLLEHGQDKAIAAILNEMAGHFNSNLDHDLFIIHFETLMGILEHYKQKRLLAPVVFGLNILADIVVRHEPTVQSMTELRLEALLNPPLLEALLQVPHEDPLRKQFDGLIHSRGIGLLKPLLQGLFQFEDRLSRKRVLEYLHKMGPSIFGELVEELEKSQTTPTPWYVKRNLLHLMAGKPPANLTPYLEGLLTENHPKLLDLVYKCIFMIHDPGAFRLGKQLIHEHLHQGPQLARILNFVGLGKEKAYTPILIQLMNDDLPDEVRLNLAVTLGKLDSDLGGKHLRDIVGKTSLFSSKKEDFERGIAAKGLGHSKSKINVEFMAKYTKDRNPTVREAAQQMVANQG